MPVTYQFDDRIVVLEIAGSCSIMDILGGFERASADAAFPEEAVLLVKFIGVKEIFTRTVQEINAMTNLASLAGRYHYRMAVVAPEDLAFGLMRMGSIGADDRGISVGVFRDDASARVWLLA